MSHRKRVRMRRLYTRVRRLVRRATSSLRSGWWTRHPGRDVFMDRRGRVGMDGERIDALVCIHRRLTVR